MKDNLHKSKHYLKLKTFCLQILRFKEEINEKHIVEGSYYVYESFVLNSSCNVISSAILQTIPPTVRGSTSLLQYESTDLESNPCPCLTFANGIVFFYFR